MQLYKWLNSTRYFDAEKGGNGGTAKSPAELQREQIKMTGSTSDDKDKEETEKEDDKEVEKEETEETEEGEEPEEGDEEEGEKEEVKASEEDTKKELEKLRKTVDRLQKRVGKTAGERDTIKKELREAKASLEAKLNDGEQPLTEAEVERRATEKANQTVTQREFDAAQTRLAKAAIKVDKDFMTKITEMAEEIAPIPGAMIGMLDDLEHENGGAVLAYLANNPDDFEEIHTLNLVKMARRLDKISEKLFEEAKPKKKAISKVPAPNEPVGANAGNNNSMILTGKESMQEFVRKRQMMVEARRKEKMR